MIVEDQAVFRQLVGTLLLGATTVSCSAADAAGNTATASFTVTAAYSWSGFLPPINAANTRATADAGNHFRYNPAARQYTYNWSTKGLAPGTYRLFLNLGDGVERTVDVGLK
jgi:hypothetical protein